MNTRKHIKMNENNNYLSLGNLFNLIKMNAYNKSSAMQSELFCALFEVDEINTTTVNNYCIGYRPIGIEYKRIYVDLYKKYKDDKNVFIPIVLSLISIMDEHIYKVNDQSIEIINNNANLKKLCNELLSISKNDEHIKEDFINNVQMLIEKNDLYAAIIEFITYTVLENAQPIYIKQFKINLNNLELEDYMKVKLYEGISYITSLKELAAKGNMYANAELGSLEFSGLISGHKDIMKSYYYYLEAAKKNHPKGCWMVANLILTNRVGNYENDFKVAWKYLEKAIDLGSVAAINTMGNCYLNGVTPIKKKDEHLAIKYYKEASELGYVYAYNNVGLIYEKKGDLKTAFKYYKTSADFGESWALNKVGEYYRKQDNLKTAYFYYLKASECPIDEINYYSYYNLAKYFYLNEEDNYTKGIEYLKIAAKNGILEAHNLLSQIEIS
jgi:TPR repeat protein